MRYPVHIWILALLLLALRMGAFTLLSDPWIAGVVARWMAGGLLLAALVYGILSYRGD